MIARPDPVRAGRQVSRQRRAPYPAPPESPEAGAELRQPRDHRVGHAGRCRRCVRRRHGYTGALPITATADRRRGGYVLLPCHGGVLRLAVPLGGWTRVERKRLYVIGVLFLAAALFWSLVRAGRLDAEPLRRPQHATTSIFGWSFPSSWFQSVNALFIIVFRAGVRLALDPARHARQSRRARSSSRSG